MDDTLLIPFPYLPKHCCGSALILIRIRIPISNTSYNPFKSYGSGSDFLQVKVLIPVLAPVPVPAPYLDPKKLSFHQQKL